MISFCGATPADFLNGGRSLPHMHVQMWNCLLFKVTISHTEDGRAYNLNIYDIVKMY